MQCVGLGSDAELRAAGSQVATKGFLAAEDMSDDLIDTGNTKDVLMYLFLVRLLRLADQKSQEAEQ